ncbi:MAG: DUF2271 domain-containing protein [Gammaproteobacteria bacterium]
MRSPRSARFASIVLAAGVALAAAVASASEMNVAVELPKLEVAEYHRPYLAMWIEREDQSFVTNLTVWYQDKRGGGPGGAGGGEGGTKWLNELRTWWRKSGREQTFPIDGVTGPTKAAGIQQLKFSGDKAPLASLAPGKYRLVVEAARESGGREVVRVPFEWPAKSPQSLTGKGTGELGTIALNVSP